MFTNESDNAKKLDSLKERSVRVYDGMIAVYPHFDQEEVLNILDLASKFNGCYATNNSTICFVSDNEVFVTPYTCSVLIVLLANGFKEEYFYVPFSNGDHPKAEQAKWNALRKNARHKR